jgi:hypothetical protein
MKQYRVSAAPPSNCFATSTRFGSPTYRSGWRRADRGPAARTRRPLQRLIRWAVNAALSCYRMHPQRVE